MFIKESRKAPIYPLFILSSSLPQLTWKKKGYVVVVVVSQLDQIIPNSLSRVSMALFLLYDHFFTLL